MALTVIITLCFIFLPFKLPCSTAQQQQTWIQAGYWFPASDFPIADINSALFTHLICAFAGLNSSTYQLNISSSDNQYFSTFTNTVKQKNPSIKTLLSIGGGNADGSIYSSMISQSSYRKSFIDSSVRTARSYGFHGLDLNWVSASTESEMANMAILLDEWRAAIESEARNSSGSTQLILTMAVNYSPNKDNTTFPIESIKKNLNWVHVMAYDYYKPQLWDKTAAHAALYNPGNVRNTDYGINAWTNSGLSANKLVLGLPFYGYGWKLVNPKDSAIGAPAKGPANSDGGAMRYVDIKSYIQRYGAAPQYNVTYVVNYCTNGSTWIGYDDVEVVKIKVAYARKKNLLGYYVWHVSNDDNWVLSKAAAQEGDTTNYSHNKRGFLLVILLPTIALIILILGLAVWYQPKRILRFIGLKDKEKESQSILENTMACVEDIGDTNAPNLHAISLTNIVVATNNFSIENKLGEGGYGPVYKGKLLNGQEIAVKRLSKASKQGFEEFKNEVMLTARLQHVNLVRVLGFCTEREEQMLIYEYMPNKSLDCYIYDPIRRLLLDWEMRFRIIEGVTQGLLYLQEYSRLTIIHRDLKVSNILLDNEMKAKIADFGMAKIFQKDGLEANTGRIVGTYGYVPPEYVRHGIYSTKSDVYSFGVLLLQIISGKKNNCSYGVNESLNLLEYAYELWKDGKGMEFIDPSLDDTYSSCKCMRCMQIALLCVQEHPADRPSMLEISSMLKSETTTMNTPKRPAFCTKKDEDDEDKFTPQQEIFSVADASNTQIVAR